MTHPDRILAKDRARQDAFDNRYDNRETSQGAKVAYDVKFAEVRRNIQGCG